MKRLLIILMFCALGVQAQDNVYFRWRVDEYKLADANQNWEEITWKDGSYLTISMILDKKYLEQGSLTIHNYSKSSKYIILYGADVVEVGSGRTKATRTVWSAISPSNANCNISILNYENNVYMDEIKISFSNAVMRYTIRKL